MSRDGGDAGEAVLIEARQNALNPELEWQKAWFEVRTRWWVRDETVEGKGWESHTTTYAFKEVVDLELGLGRRAEDVNLRVARNRTWELQHDDSPFLPRSHRIALHRCRVGVTWQARVWREPLIARGGYRGSASTSEWCGG